MVKYKLKILPRHHPELHFSTLLYFDISTFKNNHFIPVDKI